MEVPSDNPNEDIRLKRFPPGFFETIVDWTNNTASPACTGKALGHFD